MKAVGLSVSDRRRASCRRLIAVDAGWDALLGIGCLVTAVPGGAGPLGLAPVTGWPVRAALLGVGLGSLGYGVLLARSATDEDTALAICRPTALANGAGALALATGAVLIPANPFGTALLAVAALGCAAFAGAESQHPR